MKEPLKRTGLQAIREHFHFTSLLKPIIYAVIFSVVYNLGYLWISGHLMGALYNVLSILWLCLYGLAWYFVATLAFGRRRGTLNAGKVSIVLLWFLLWDLLCVFVIVPAYNFVGLHGSNTFLMIIVQLIAAFLLIGLIPASILLFKGLYLGIIDLRRLMRAIIRAMMGHASSVFNSWLILFLVMVVWDTLFSGPLTIYFGFNAVHLLMELLFLGNPMSYWMLLLSAAGGGISGSYMYAVVLNILAGLIFIFVDLNMIVYIGGFLEE